MFVDFDKFMGVYLKGRVGCAQRKQPGEPVCRFESCHFHQNFVGGHYEKD